MWPASFQKTESRYRKRREKWKSTGRPGERTEARTFLKSTAKTTHVVLIFFLPAENKKEQKRKKEQ